MVDLDIERALGMRVLASNLAPIKLEDVIGAKAALDAIPSEKFCCIKEPDNPFWNERFECKDCGENFITRCDGFRLKSQIAAKDATIAAQAALIEELIGAINWACGCGDDEFTVPEGVNIAQRRYWWRTELVRRAGPIYDGVAYVPKQSIGERPDITS